MSSSDDLDDVTAGDDPTEEVGPDGCGSTPADCDMPAGDRDQPPEECAFSMHDELTEQFPVEPIPVVKGPDGLPQPVDQALSFAPPFTHEHVVCIEDKRKYVELFKEDLIADNGVGSRGWIERPVPAAIDDRGHPTGPYTHRWTPPGAIYFVPQMPDLFKPRSRFDAHGQEREPEEFPPDEVCKLWGVECVKLAQDMWLPVRPIRERCQYYKRQVFNNDEQPDPTEPGHRIVFTNCTIRRSVGGAFLSLRDQAIYACDYRDPPEPKSVRVHLDAFDEKRLAEKGHTKLVPLFGLGGDDLVKDDDEEDDE